MLEDKCAICDSLLLGRRESDYSSRYFCPRCRKYVSPRSGPADWIFPIVFIFTRVILPGILFLLLVAFAWSGLSGFFKSTGGHKQPGTDRTETVLPQPAAPWWRPAIGLWTGTLQLNGQQSSVTLRVISQKQPAYLKLDDGIMTRPAAIGLVLRPLTGPGGQIVFEGPFGLRIPRLGNLNGYLADDGQTMSVRIDFWNSGTVTETVEFTKAASY